MSRRFLVTGGAGFIGSHFCRLALKEKWCDELINVDGLTYSGNLNNLSEMSSDSRYAFVHQDLNDPQLAQKLSAYSPDYVIHFAAESHVDRSIENADLFLKTNILGTHHLLQYVKDLRERTGKDVRFLYVSTDEVYGSLGEEGYFFETTPLQPRSPYSVSKAAGDMLASAFFHTFHINLVTVRCSNNYGPNQFPEKLIPQTIIFALQGRKIPVYGAGTNVRDWIYVEDFARGIYAALMKGRSGEAYNFGGQSERRNIEVVKNILKLVNRGEDLIEFVTDRKGHDFRYAINFDKSASELNWKPTVTFEEGLARTVSWYQRNEAWWKDILSGEYQKFFSRYYGESLEKVKRA